MLKLDAKAKKIELESGEPIEWDALLLATGAEPVRLGVPGRRASALAQNLRRLPRSDRAGSIGAPCRS